MSIANKRKASSLFKGTQSMLDHYLNMPDLDETDTAEFNVAITNTKRIMDQ
jgi:hypothetical protein